MGATATGTASFPAAVASDLPAGHFRLLDGLTVSSIGLGSYLGDEDDAADRAYTAAALRAVELGCNVIDTAINYRGQRSERALGRALAELARARRFGRDQLVVCTKGGYLPFDAFVPPDPGAYLRDTYVRSGLLAPEDVVAGCHAMTSRFLEDQLARSLANLQVDQIDVYYLHNPETQLDAVPREEFLGRIRLAFATLEQAVAAGRIARYGVATWNGFRQPPDARDHLSLAELVEQARAVAGATHHFRVIQLPHNLAMPEAHLLQTQQVRGHSRTPLEAAAELDVHVIASASILQGQLSRRLPQAVAAAFPALDTPAQRALQFVRSTPGVITALVGMSRIAHVDENLTVARTPPEPAGVDSLVGRR